MTRNTIDSRPLVPFPPEYADPAASWFDTPVDPHRFDHADRPAYALQPRRGNYDIILAVFCVLLIVSNICAVKLIAIGPVTIGSVTLGPLITDGGAILFPLTYILGDVLSEVYGLKAARRAILLGFGMSILVSVTFLIVQVAPPAPEWTHQQAYVDILGFVPRIVLASICGYLVGQFLNAVVLVRIKEQTKEKHLWARLVGSTVVGELADTVVFCTIAFFGILTGTAFANYVITGYVYKVTVEVVFLPVTYAVIRAIKRREPDYRPIDESDTVT